MEGNDDTGFVAMDASSDSSEPNHTQQRSGIVRPNRNNQTIRRPMNNQMTRVIRFTSRSSGSPQQSLAMGVNGGSILDMISQLFGSGSSSSDNAPPMDLRMLMNGGFNGNGNVGFGDYYMGDMSALLQHIRENFEP